MAPASKVLIVVFAVLLIACNKKDKDPVVLEPEPTPIPTVPSDIPACETLPKEPKPFGWTDSTTDIDRNVIAFNYSPVNPDQIIYVATGDITGFYPLYNLNVTTGVKQKLGNAGYFLPSLNKSNWMVYSTIDNNLVKIKCNGDSALALSSDFRNLNPQWDYSGKYIYFFKQANFSIGSQIQKISNTNDVVTVEFPADIPQFASFKKSDKILYCQTSGTLATLVERVIPSGNERSLISGPFDVKTGKVHFNHICVDNNDEFAYWANTVGIFRFHLSSLKLDTLFKNCDNRIFDSPQISTQTGELSFSVHVKKQIGTAVLLHEYKTMLSPPRANEATLIRLFPN